MKIIHAALRIVIVLLASSGVSRIATADLIFDFVVTDGSDSGGGFFDTGTAAGFANVKALTDTASYLSSVLDHSAVLKINLSTRTTGSIATGGGFHYIDPSASGVIFNAVQNELLLGVTPPAPTDAHGFMSINTTKSFYAGEDPAGIGAEKDLRTVFLHEMTHVLGWGSYIKADGSSALSDAFMEADPEFEMVDELYSLYDTFLVDKDGSPLIDPASEDFVPGSDLSGVLIGGPEAVAVGDGLIPTSISPIDFDPTHILSSEPIDTLMNPGLPDGVLKREYADVDRAVLKDLGYSFSAVPEPSTFVCLSLGIWCGALRRKRAR